MKQTYSEEEFKILLKNLFTEKYRVHELQRKLIDQEQGEIQPLPPDSSLENKELKERFEKIKPALQQLVAELKSAKETIEQLQREKEETVEEKKRQEKLLMTLENEKKGYQNWREEQEKRGRDVEEKKGFEEERQNLIERLSDTLTQLQRQNDINKDLREEIVSLHRELKLVEQEKKRIEDSSLDILTKEKIENVEISLKEWREKYQQIHKEWLTLKEGYRELEIMKNNYEKALLTIASIKELLHKLSL